MTPDGVGSLLEQVRRAINRHDVDASVGADAPGASGGGMGCASTERGSTCRGIVIYGVEDGRIVRGRLYMSDLPEHTDAKEEK